MYSFGKKEKQLGTSISTNDLRFKHKKVRGEHLMKAKRKHRFVLVLRDNDQLREER